MKLIILLTLFTAITLNAQELSLMSQTKIVADSFAGIDSYNNIYTVTNNTFIKSGSEGEFYYVDYQLGNISQIDLINPLKIMLFYESLNTVVFLDNRLNEIERVDFNALSNPMNIGACRNAGNNRLWIFNVETQQIELYNYRNQSKINISQPFPDRLRSLSSNFNYCFALTDEAIRAYNIYGSLLSEFSATNFEKIKQLDENLIGLKNNQLYYLSKNTPEFVKVKCPEITIKGFDLSQDFVYIYDGNYLHTFKLIQPKK